MLEQFQPAMFLFEKTKKKKKIFDKKKICNKIEKNHLYI